MQTTCDVGIIGAGVIGLTCALCLCRAGFRVKIIARNLPGDQTTDWASPWAGAVICPSPSDNETDIKMQTASFRHYWKMAHNDTASGVKAIKVAAYWDDQIASPDPWYSTLTPGFRSIPLKELPPGVTSGHSFMSTTINPDLFLPWLRIQLQSQHGVEFHHDEVQSLDEARHVLGCKVLVNATGLGARVLANDGEVIGIRGQTMLIKESDKGIGAPSSMSGEMAIRRGAEYTYFIPRAFSGGIILGGIEDEGSTNTQVDNALREDILRRVNVLTGGKFRDVDLKRDVVRDIVGFRPGRKSGPRIEREGKVVHAYGFGGVGYKYSFGAAQRVVQMVEDALTVSPKL